MPSVDEKRIKGKKLIKLIQINDLQTFYHLRLREQMKNNYEIDVNHRREYVKTFSNGGSK